MGQQIREIILDSPNPSISFTAGRIRPDLQPILVEWNIGSWWKNTDPTTEATGLWGAYCKTGSTGPGNPGVWENLYVSVAFDVDSVVANIAALKALNTTSMANGHKVWVLTKKAPYHFDKAAATVADVTAGHSYIQPTTGGGMFTRQMIPVPEWQALCSGAGMFIDPTGGNDEGVGSSTGTAILSMQEFNYRMSGAYFIGTSFATSPKLFVFGAGDASPANGIYTGWACDLVSRLYTIGIPTVVAAGVTITATGDMLPTVSAGFLTSTTTDFNALGYKSNASRTLWARRTNTSGGATTFAALFNTHNTGGNFSVDISPQIQMITTSPAVPSQTTQPFAPGDVIDLVSFPVLGSRMQRDMAIGNIVPVMMDFANNYTVRGFMQGWIVGSRGVFTAVAGASDVNIVGGQFNGNVGSQYATSFKAQFVNFGAQGLSEAVIQSQGASIELSFKISSHNARFEAVTSGSLTFFAGSAWLQSSSKLFRCNTWGKLIIRDGFPVGVGANVVLGGEVTDGGRISGTEFLDQTLFSITNPTPWNVDGDLFATADLGRMNMETLSAIVTS